VDGSNRLQLNTSKTEILRSPFEHLPQSLLRVDSDYVAAASVIHDLGINRDSDVYMRSHVVKTVSACYGVLRQLWSVRRSLPRSVLQSRMSSLVLSRLDYGNATLAAGIPSYLLQQLQSLLNSAARLVFSSTRYDHISPLLQQLHWLRALDRIQFKLAVLMYKCLHGTAPSYLADELEYTADFEAQRRLQSAFSLSLNVRHTRLSTVSDRAFPVAAVHTWNSLPQHVCFLCMFSEVASSGIISQDFHRNFCTTCSLAQ